MMNYFYGYDDTEVNEAKNLIKLLDERIHNVLEKLNINFNKSPSSSCPILL